MTNIAVKVQGVSKSFLLPHQKKTSIKSLFLSLWQKKSYETQEVLRDISFEIKEGEFFGIVGRNGSGKSTLLKLLAGIYTPDDGNVQVNGKLTPFIELGVGFNPELTGRENVFLNGALLGFNRKEMEKMYEDIVAFAELERFMDQKLKNYSSGMQVRLAFSIAIRARTDVLLIDEVLAVGDTAFQKKCYEHFLLLKKRKKTVILVTHDMSAVERFCDRAMVIHQGDIKGIFTPRRAASLYDELNSEGSSKKEVKEEEEKKGRWGTNEVEITNIDIKNAVKKIDDKFFVRQGEDLVITFYPQTRKPVDKIVVGMAFFNQFGTNVSGPNSLGVPLVPNKKLSFTIPKLSFNPGEYGVTLVVFDKEMVIEYDHIERGIQLEVMSDGHQYYGAINVFGRWKQSAKK